MRAGKQEKLQKTNKKKRNAGAGELSVWRRKLLPA